MTAQVRLDWKSVVFVASKVSGWVAFKREINLAEHPGLLSTRAVYVIRIVRPFTFSYGERHSPVAYIGKGQAQARLTSHLKSWIPQLSRKIPDLKIEIFYCEPRVRKLGRICEGVEADLIKRFVDAYGRLPLRNRNTPTKPGNRTYKHEELAGVLHPGKGTGYHWGLTPLGSSHFYRA